MKSSARILHILSQRPGLTGSGVCLDAVIRLAHEAGYQQSAVIGVPAGQRGINLGGLPAHAIHPVYFKADEGLTASLTTPPCDLNFSVAGMSDVMPYPSTIWSSLDNIQIQAYRDVWCRHLIRVIDQFQPDLIHSNHLWLVTSLLKDLAVNIPVVATCHATGLRQMYLCPHLAEEVRGGCGLLDHICVLHQDHCHEIVKTVDIKAEQITVTGIGFRDEIFNRNVTAYEDTSRPHNILFIGKYSHAKGLPWLLDAFESWYQNNTQLHLHIAGSGSGPEADKLQQRMANMGSCLTMHGMLDQESLANLMGRCAVVVLPSFYEGVPLVLAEAAACGCHLVATELPGIIDQLAPVLGKRLYLVPLPSLGEIDKPEAADMPHFVKKLAATINSASQQTELSYCDLSSLTWRKVFQRIESIWNKYI